MERKDRLRFLIGFINENGVLGKVRLLVYYIQYSSQGCYRCLKQVDNALLQTPKSSTQGSNSGHYTVIESSRSLIFHGKYAGRQFTACSSGFFERPLVEAVVGYMEKSGEGYHEDIMRAFFRLQVRSRTFLQVAFTKPYAYRLVTSVAYFLS